ncbi:MAG: hypothetical protein JST83_11800 [Bacteroidetes bacterium]|nr:hypothetical protein [Bacteroidota bacterium]
MKLYYNLFLLAGPLSSLALIVILLAPSCESRNHTNSLKPESQDSLASGLKLLSDIKLSNVKGGFDLMAVDIKKQRLFVSAEDNHTVEVVDLAHSKTMRSIPDIDEPKWVVYMPEVKSIFISTGGDGRVTELNDSSFAIKHIFEFKEKCNNLRYDTTTHLLFVGIGKTFGSIGAIDVAQSKILYEIPLAHYPKQFEVTDSLIYVNVPQKNLLQIIDRTLKKVISEITVTENSDNVPMALDRTHGRLFIGCQKGKLLVYSIQSRRQITNIDIKQDVDGIYYDSKRRRLYLSCGEGYMETISQTDADHYVRLQSQISASGAATSLYSPELDKFFLAVPHTADHNASIRIYQPQN